MSLLKFKTKRLNRLKNAWWINDWSSRVTINKGKKNITLIQESSKIVLKSNEDSFAMIKTKNFLNESIKASKTIDGTIIFGSTTSIDVQELHEILLNIQPLGWIFIPGGKKNEK